MREMQEAIEVGCRAIEAYLKDRGQQTSFHVQEVNTRRDAIPIPTDFGGHQYGTGTGAIKMDVALVGVHMGEIPKAKQRERSRLRAELKESGTSVTPDVAPDPGYRAGIRALLDKFQKGIKNATELAEGGTVPPHIRQLVTQAGTVRDDDIVVKLLAAVMDRCDEVRAAEERVERVEEKLKENPEMQLHERLKLKMKAQYTDQRDVLLEFMTWLEDEDMVIPKAVNAVDDFLENI